MSGRVHCCQGQLACWFLICFIYFFASAETSSWGSADATTRPCRQPDCHDAGHPGPGPVLLQCQADDGESPSPACTLKKPWRAAESGWVMRRWRRSVASFFARIFWSLQPWTGWLFCSVLGRVRAYFCLLGWHLVVTKVRACNMPQHCFKILEKQGEKPEEGCLLKGKFSVFEM